MAHHRQPSDDALYAIDAGQIRALRRVMKRLFTEDRMDGNDMRDAAQTIEAVLRRVEEIEIPS